MATLNEIAAALRKADAAGDTEAARRLARAYSSLKSDLLEAYGTPKKEAGFFGSFKEAVSQLGLADEAAAFAANPTRENREAFLKAAESKYKSVGGFGKGRNWEAFKEMLGSSLGSLVAPVGAAFAGAAAGPIGAATAFGGTSAAQYEIAGLQRQAEEQRAAEQEGKPVPELSLGKATAAAFGQAALDVIPGAYVAKSLRAFPIAQRLLGPEKTAQEAADILIDAYKKGNLTRKGEVLKGVGLSVAFEVPQEVAQQALERWQAGLSLTDDDAREEFKQAAIGAAVLAPLFGGPAGLGQYKAKVNEIGQQYARDAEMLFGGQAPEQVGFTPEMYDRAAEADRRDAAEAIFGEPSEEGGIPARMYDEQLRRDRFAQVKDVEQRIRDEAEARRREKVLSAAEKRRLADEEEAQRLADEQQDQFYEDYRRQQEEAAAQQEEATAQPAPTTTPTEEPSGVPEQIDRTQEYADKLRESLSGLEQLKLTGLGEEGPPEGQGAPVTVTPRTQEETDQLTEEVKAFENEDIKAAKDLLAAVDKGGMILNPAKVNDVARNLGLDVSPKAKPLDTVGRIRDAVARVEPTQYAQEAPAETTGEQSVTEQPATTAATTGITETDTGTVGGGAELPAPRTRARKRAVAKPEPAGVDDTGVPATDVVEGEGELPSALEAPDTRVQDWLASNKKTRAPEDSALISAALDVVRATNKLSAVALQTKLGITMSKAKALRQALLGSGAVVQKTNVKGAKEAGNYFVVEGQYKPTETVRRVEPTVEETTEKPTPFEREAPLSEGERIRQEMEKAEERRGETPPKPRMEPVKTAKGELADEVRRMFADLEQEEAAKTSAEGQGALDLVGGKAKVERDSAVEKIRKDLIAAGKFLRKEGKMSDSEAARIDRILSKRKPNLEKVRELINKINAREEAVGVQETTKEEVDQLDFDEAGEKYDAELYDYSNLGAYENLSDKFGERPRRSARALNRFKRGKTRTRGLKASDAEVAVESFIKNWRNAPKIVVVQNYKELPMEEGVDPDSYADTLGMTSGDTVYLVADNIRSLGELKAVLYHESLGHYGLGQLFREQLTKVMHDIYRTNPKIRAAADAWLDANPDAYPEDQYSQAEREALAVEELMAEHAEDGPMRDPSWRRAFYRVASVVRKFARAMARMVGKDLAYSNSEVADIIIQAHDKVLTGKVNLIPRYNNVRFMRSQYTKTLGDLFDYVDKKAPEATKKILFGNINALSNLPINMQIFRLKTLSMHHMTEMFEKYAPSIAKLEILFERVAASDTQMQTAFAKKYSDYRTIFRDNQRYVEEFDEVAHLVNLSQVPLFQWNDTTKKFEIDPASNRMLSITANSAQYNALNDKDKVLHEAAVRFNALPAIMQQTMINIASDYRNYSDQAFAIKFDELLSKLTPAVAQRIKNQFQTNRLQFYLPLRREQGGEYKLRWIDSQGREVSKLYSSEAARTFGEKQATAQGGSNFVTSMVEAPKGTARRVPTGLLKELTDGIAESLRASGANQRVIDDSVALIFDTFVDYMPATSGNNLRQEISSRKQFVHNGVTYYGRIGFDTDVLGVYGNAIPTIIHQLNNLKYLMRLENVRKKIDEELKAYNANKLTDPRYAGLPDVSQDMASRIKANLDDRINFAKNPYYSPYVYTLSKANYLFSIALNVSSAIVNTTIIPMMTWPSLAAKYGVVDASVAIAQATKMYFKNSYTDPQTGKLRFNTNPTFGASPLSRELDLLHRTLENRSVVGTAAEQELRQAEAIKIPGYEGLSAKVDLIMSYAFRTSERYNREVTALATYMLARNINPDGSQRTAGRGQASVRKAMEEAIRLNKDVNGASLKETNNSLYQTDIGRIVLTFRTHALNMIINLAMTMRNAINAVDPDPVQRKLLTSIARKKLLGIFGATYMFAGIKGMPLYGAAEVLASWLMGDDDEPYDLEQEVLDAVGTLGLNGPVNELFNIDVASRTGFNGLLWRDDPKRLAEIGAPLYILERVAGPTYGLVERARRGFDDFSNGHVVRGLEEFTPAPIRNMIKGTRYAIDGAQTKDGLPLVDDVSAYNSVMQVLGFAPADLAVSQSQLGATYQIGEKLKNRRVALLTKFYAARKADNPEAMQDALESIAKFNDANPSYGITGDTLLKSFRERERRAAEAVNGVRQPRNLRMATSRYVADLEDEDEDEED